MDSYEKELLDKAQSGDPEDQFELALFYEDKERWDDAIHWYELSAAQDFSSAIRNLGGLYVMTHGDMEHNPKKALEYFLKAIDLDNNSARIAAASLYMCGDDGIDCDPELAFRLVEEAADNGDEEGIMCLGNYYENGLGVEKNEEVAMTYYKKGKQMGSLSADAYISMLEDKMANAASGELPDWISGYVDSANSGDATAQYTMGYFYYSGAGIPQDYTKAVEWFLKGADQNNDFSLFFLGECYKNGTGVAADTCKAKKYYEKAAKLGNENAKVALKSL